jgi:hypothetical protein
VSVVHQEHGPVGAPDRLILRQAATGRETLSIPGRPDEWCRAALLSPDGKLLAVQAKVIENGMGFYLPEETLRLYEVATGKEVVALGKSAPRPAVAFSPEGNYLATLGRASLWATTRNAEISLWDQTTGQERRHYAGHQNEARAVAFAPDGRTMATASDDGTVLVWDVASLPPVRHPRPSALDALWGDLAGGDAGKAYRAVGQLASAPDRAVALLRDRLPAATPVAPERVAALIADLDDDAFATREQARQELEKLAERAGPALRRALAGKPSAELKRQAEALLARLGRDAASPERLGPIRVTAVLERVGSPAARRLLQAWAGGDPDARLTAEAKAALERLAKRPAPTHRQPDPR